MVVGGPYSSGVLVGGTHFQYQPAPPEVLDRVKRITELATGHGVGVKAAALQFSLAHRGHARARRALGRRCRR